MVKLGTVKPFKASVRGTPSIAQKLAPATGLTKVALTFIVNVTVKPVRNTSRLPSSAKPVSVITRLTLASASAKSFSSSALKTADFPCLVRILPS